MHFLVELRGDAHQAMGLLAAAGIQNLVSSDDPTGRLIARVSADDLDTAADRVRAAVGDGYIVGGVRRED